MRPSPFFEVFEKLNPDPKTRGALRDGTVTAVTVDRASLSAEADVEFPSGVSEDALRAAERALEELFGLKKFTIRAAVKSGELDPARITDALKREHPQTMGFLDGCEFEYRGSELYIILPHGGEDLLREYSRFAEDFCRDMYGHSMRVVFSNAREVDEIREEIEREKDEAIRAAVKSSPVKAEAKKAPPGAVIYGRSFKENRIPISGITQETGKCCIKGTVFAVLSREIKKRGGYVVCFEITDYTGSIRISKFMKAEEAAPLVDCIKVGMEVVVQGTPQYSRYDDDIVMEPYAVLTSSRELRADGSEDKRVELHLHTKMSSMDGMVDAAAAVERAAKWGHRALAITDHGVLQAYPEAMAAAKKHGIKVIYGVEGYFLNDYDGYAAVSGRSDRPLDSEFVVFDLETTGLDASVCEIIEIGAVLLRGGEVRERFQTFVKPKKNGGFIPPEITSLTGISEKHVKRAPPIEQALPDFIAFAGDRPLVAHNAGFDCAFIEEACRKAGIRFEFTSVDTVNLSRALLPGLSSHKLNVVAEALKLPDFNHHRADDDAETAARIFAELSEMLRAAGVTRVSEINEYVIRRRREGFRDARQSRRSEHVNHIILLARNEAGLRNLYELVSISHLRYFKKYPIILRSLLDKYREGLIVGSACERGEVFAALTRGKPYAQIRKIAEYYDYLEIQPIENNMFMLRNGSAKSVEELRDFNRRIAELGADMGIPVSATGDVHVLDEHDAKYRRILMAGKGFQDTDGQAALNFKTTGEMLAEFSYLGEEKAREVVIENTNLIADMCADVKPIRSGTYSPDIDGSSEQLKEIVERRVAELYGENPPAEVTERLNLELEAIIKHHFDVIYMIAQKLVSKSVEDGYLVGSRGSVGSSVVAYFLGVTEVNAYPAHYRCPSCLRSEFPESGLYPCGADMPDKDCPVCGGKYVKDGFDIPFATFLGFDGDKKPDIDLNFSGEYQAEAHRQTVELFGEGHVFRAGTIGTLKEKTAYGFVKKYLEERGETVTKAEENRLVAGCVGVKRTTGQHPGGLIIVPRDLSIYDFCPVQHPADDTSTDIITTHFDYHSIEENLLKLDLLGHDDPTMLRMLSDLTGADPTSIPLDDPETMSIFTSTKALGFEDDPTLGKTGACAVPEFGTKFVREMLMDTKPETFDELVRISGLSHGTDVWLGNAQELIKSGLATLKEVICARDDILIYLMHRGLPKKLAFDIMELVRRGKKDLTPEMTEAMRQKGVPDWYIESCNKIKYMFPKAHAVAYVIMAFRIAWFKVHHPLAFYCAYFTIRAGSFNPEAMIFGIDRVRAKIRSLEEKQDATAAEKDMLITLEVCYEFYRRGFFFERIDIEKSDALRYLITENGLLPPLVSVPGLGEVAARSVAAERGGGFMSVEDLQSRCSKVTKAHIEQLSKLGALGDLPESTQISLF